MTHRRLPAARAARGAADVRAGDQGQTRGIERDRKGDRVVAVGLPHRPGRQHDQLVAVDRDRGVRLGATDDDPILTTLDDPSACEPMRPIVKEALFRRLRKSCDGAQTPGGIQSKAFDLSKKEEAIACGNWCLQKGTPGILVNNAGNFLPGNVYNEEDGLLENQIQTNLYSAYHLTRILLPKMMEAKSGHIFNMCSIASIDAYPNGGSYSLSKWALLGFTKNLRVELMQYNIKVTAVIPGAVYTDSWKDFVNPERIMQPEDISTMVYAASMLSPQACVEEILFRPQLGDL